MSEPLISVIIPVYNAEKYLRSCLDSVLAQTYKNWEAVCVNDGSTDNSQKILEEYAAKDNRFLIINQENGGGSSSRNRALKNINGQFVAFLDNDDLYHPQYLEILYTNLQNTHADISCCSYLKMVILTIILQKDIPSILTIFKLRRLRLSSVEKRK